MAIKKVWIEEGCIADGICNDICPAVFGLDDDTGEAYVKEGVDFNAYADDIKEASESCPVLIIKYDEE
ncbi:MAG TPA: ferredoxin [Mariniphaga sp.]|nr:ferredoxin [Mariniphaga sp.]